MAGPIRISILANGAQARREMASTAGFAQRSFKRLAGGAGATLGIAAVVGLGKAAINTEKQFSQSMSLIRAATDASGSAMGDLQRLAVKLGADTAFSANDAADAMLELAKAGIDVKTIMRGGIQGTLTLAAAGGTELGTAATIASNALNTFGLKGRDMASVAAALAGGANASSASVESLGEALSQVGPGARNAGLSLQETVAALSAFDAAGIKGSDAGTSLKTMLARLIPASERAEDAMEKFGLQTEAGNNAFVKANGEFESLATIAGVLQKRLGPLSDAQRTTALNTIFGSDASRAATVLLKEGADGVRKYTRATSDQGAAQKMAKARMEGTAGSLERLSGAVETAKLRIGQELAPVVQSAADGLGANLVPAIESGIKGAKALASEMAPAVKAVRDLLEDLVPSGEDAGSMFNDVLLPAVGATADVVTTVAKALDALPEPVKDIGVQAGIAALILPRFTAAVSSASTSVGINIARLQQLRAEMTYTATRAQLLQGAMTRMAGAARVAAGVGGMVALTQAASETNDSLQVLESVGGGALLGFSVGGPVGAAIGATAGGLLALKQNADKSGEAAKTAAVNWETLAGSLDQTTGAINRQTRATVVEDLAKSGLLAKATSLGINQRTLVNGILGETNARRSLRGLLVQQEQAAERLGRAAEREASRPGGSRKRYGELSREYERRLDIIRAIRESIGAEDQATRTKAEQLALINRIPKKLQLELQSNIPKTAEDFARLDEKMGGLSRRQLRVAIRLSEADVTIAQIRKIQEKLRETGQLKPDFGPYNAGLNQEMGVARRNARNNALGINDTLETTGKTRANTRTWQQSLAEGLGDGRTRSRRGMGDINDLLGGSVDGPNMGPFTGAIQAGITQGRGIANTADSVGAALANGVAAGVRARAAAIAAEARGAVAAAVLAAQAAARAKSPSRETFEKVGVPLADGVTAGLKAGTPRAKKQARSLVGQIIAAVHQGSDGVDNALDRISNLVESSVNLKDAKAERQREAAIIKSLRERYKQLRLNGQAQDHNSRLLEAAVQKHRDLVRASKEYAAGIKSSVIAYGSVISAGEGNGFGSFDQLAANMEERVKRAQQYARMIRELVKAGLNRTTIQQLLDAGVEGGFGTAQALLTGGQAGITQINQLQSQLAQTGQSLGNSMARTFHQAGIQAAAGVVRGLRDRQRDLDRAATRMAAALVRAVRKQLGIKSPSRVFKDLGDQTMRGLELGLDDTRARRAGAAVAAGVKAGYARPTLVGASMGASGVGGAETIRIRLSAEQVSQLQRGKEIQADLDVYRRAGGRTLA